MKLLRIGIALLALFPILALAGGNTTIFGNHSKIPVENPEAEKSARR